LILLVVAQPKCLHKLKPSGNGHNQIQAALGSAQVKKGVSSPWALYLIPPNPPHFGVPHMKNKKNKKQNEKQNEMEVGNFIYLGNK
jgi:hypothetical protein